MEGLVVLSKLDFFGNLCGPCNADEFLSHALSGVPVTETALDCACTGVFYSAAKDPYRFKVFA